MSTDRPIVVLVHGAFAESASWNGVISRLRDRGLDAVAAGNPLRGIPSDGAYVRDVIASLDRPVILVGHSYGGMVITEAAAGNPAVRALVYVAGFAPEPGETAFLLSGKFEGSTLGDALAAYPLSGGGNELRITDEKFHQQFCADVDPAEAALMGATQRPVTERALTEGLSVDQPAWRTIPSWFVFGSDDRNIPAALMHFMADRADARSTEEITGASHALAVSQPDAVAAMIAEAAGAT
ncbi:alpha/beta hydrolase [Actinomadura sp. NAK00032]|uniref:alpha/beta fold hydrolase n=1 Tax=Actinomadura sp. NAK00032 TaxID=2742128 RepID=UPI001591446F|nr:alpha/beta hydrolase [Actinomadura sp. NAK00032]QKW33252.1 alpha/beta hydrolase [Actinomadura sp. NAK00032]